jgi:alpha-tubulin suppressor-like RCC1 family protein
VRALSVLAFGSGCTLAAGLGDPKQLGEEDSGTLDRNVQAVALAVGASHACAVIQAAEGSPENATVRCWGANAAGELGVDPSRVPSTTEPLPVDKVGDVASLALGVFYSCAVTADGYLFCWGLVPGESAGGIHREQASPFFEPSQVDLRDSPIVGVTAATAGTGGGCLLASDGLVCWGHGALELGTSLDAGVTNLDGGGAVVTNVAGAAVGGGHACIIATRRGVQDVECWGDNSHGQAGGSLGTGDVALPSPVGVSRYGEIAQVAAGRAHSCARLTAGDVYCWGTNDRGQLGDPKVSGDANVPTRVAFSTAATAVAIALGDDHACAAMSDETVQCWGDDTSGQLGFAAPAGFSAQPGNAQRVLGGVVADLARTKRIAAGGGTTCVLRWGEPNVWCWGRNDAGQAGQPPGPPVTRATAVAW